MNSERKAATLLLLAGLVAGCSHKVKTAPPVTAQAPVAPVSTMAKNTSPPQLPPPELPKVSPPAPPPAEPPPKPHKTVRHKPKTTEPVPADQQAPAQTPTKEQTASQPPAEQASNGTSADISPIGELSAAGESTNVPRRNQILDEINSTEKGVNDIKRSLTADEQTTVTQIRTFLAKAKDALNQEDLDGAHTLVTKARVLLDELTKS